jgi:hypothetical protein
MQQITADPLWDEGISSYLLGEYRKRNAPLTIDDLQGFASEQAVRVGDILETLFLMAIYGVWSYANEQGEDQVLDEDALDALYARSRLSAEDLQAFSGVWAPIR